MLADGCVAMMDIADEHAIKGCANGRGFRLELTIRNSSNTESRQALRIRGQSEVVEIWILLGRGLGQSGVERPFREDFFFPKLGHTPPTAHYPYLQSRM